MIPRSVTVKPTVYKEILFRSKSESIVAINLDRSGIHWLYEPESYLLDGEQYTPDFFLPEIDTLVEVKPEVFSSEIDRIREIVPFIGKKLVVLTPDLRATDLCYKIYDDHTETVSRSVCVRKSISETAREWGTELWTWSSWNQYDDIDAGNCPVCGHINWISSYSSYECFRCGGRMAKKANWQYYHHKTATDHLIPMKEARALVAELKAKCNKECNH